MHQRKPVKHHTPAYDIDSTAVPVNKGHASAVRGSSHGGRHKSVDTATIPKNTESDSATDVMDIGPAMFSEPVASPLGVV